MALAAATRIPRADTGERAKLRDLAGAGGIQVPSLDRRLRLSPNVVDEVAVGRPQEALRLTLASGHAVTAAGDQGFRTIDRWSSLENLIPGDHVATARVLREAADPTPWPDHEVILLAHLIGDGCVTRDPIYYCSKDDANLDAAAKAAAEFGVSTRRSPGRGVTYMHFPMLGPQGRGLTNPIYDWLRQLEVMGKPAWQKSLPAGVHCLPRDQVRLFLRHLWATDGSVTVSKSGAARIYYGTTSLALARDVQALLIREGIGARLRRTTPPKNPRHHQGWTVDVSGRADAVLFLLHVGVHGERGLRCQEVIETIADRKGNPNLDVIPSEIWNYIRPLLRDRKITLRGLATRLGISAVNGTTFLHGVSRPRMERLAAAIDDRWLLDLATSDVRWDRVVSIEPVGETEVIDVHMSEGHSYLANEIVVHDSTAC